MLMCVLSSILWVTRSTNTPANVEMEQKHYVDIQKEQEQKERV